jgi:hypothetical protein
MASNNFMRGCAPCEALLAASRRGGHHLLLRGRPAMQPDFNIHLRQPARPEKAAQRERCGEKLCGIFEVGSIGSSS